MFGLMGAIRCISGEFMRKGNRTLEQMGLTASQAEALFFLFRKEREGEMAIQRDIEAALRLSNPTVSGTLDRLEKKGFIERRPNPNNRHVNQIVLTDKARQLSEEMECGKCEMDEWLLSCLTEDERKTFEALLNKIVAHISDTQ